MTKNRKMEYQPEEEKIYPLHCIEVCSKSVKRIRDLTELEKNYLKTLEPFVLIKGTFKDRAIDTSWYSGKGENEKRVYRLDSFSNLGRDTLVTDNFLEAVAYNHKITRGIKGINRIFKKSEFIFVPLSDYLEHKDIDQEIIEHIDLQKLKKNWNMEIVVNNSKIKLIKI